jgi:hypothetical protein
LLDWGLLHAVWCLLCLLRLHLLLLLLLLLIVFVRQWDTGTGNQGG